MALLLIEGFESFGTTGTQVGLDLKYNNTFIGATTIVPGRYQGTALRLGGSSGSTQGTFQWTNPAGNFNEIVIGFAVQIESLPTAARSFVSVVDSSTLQCHIRLAPSGALEMCNGISTNIETSANGVLTANQWYYIEIKLLLHGSAGAYEVRVNGVDVLSGTGVDTIATANAFAQSVRFEGRAASGGQALVFPQFDDLYICDTTGGVHDDFLGPQIVYTRFPNAAGDDTEFTPSAGNNYQAVDDNPHDTDTTYVEGSVATTKDLYNFADVSDTDDIKAVQLNLLCRKTDATAFDIIPVAKSDATEEDAASQVVNNSAYETRYAIYTEDPDTTSPWIESGVNAAQFGFKVD